MLLSWHILSRTKPTFLLLLRFFFSFFFFLLLYNSLNLFISPSNFPYFRSLLFPSTLLFYACKWKLDWCDVEITLFMSEMEIRRNKTYKIKFEFKLNCQCLLFFCNDTFFCLTFVSEKWTGFSLFRDRKGVGRQRWNSETCFDPFLIEIEWS